MPAHPARLRAILRIQPGTLADTLWQLANQAFQQQPAHPKEDT